MFLIVPISFASFLETKQNISFPFLFNISYQPLDGKRMVYMHYSFILFCLYYKSQQMLKNMFEPFCYIVVLKF